jgi:hypothetical protein
MFVVGPSRSPMRDIRLWRSPSRCGVIRSIRAVIKPAHGGGTSEMSKPTITKLFVVSLIALVGGIVLAVLGSLVAFANGAFVMSGPDLTAIQWSPFAWSMIGITLIGIVAIIGGAIGQFVAWIGAVLNTSRLQDRTWFVVLLVVGLLSFGFVAMLVYVIAGPDGTIAAPQQVQQPQPAQQMHRLFR